MRALLWSQRMSFPGTARITKSCEACTYARKEGRGVMSQVPPRLGRPDKADCRHRVHAARCMWPV